MTDVFNNNQETYFKIGNYVPEDSVGISYFEVPDITPDNNITVINEALNISGNINNKFNIENELISNDQFILEKNIDEEGEKLIEILDKTTEGEGRFKRFTFSNPPINNTTLGSEIKFFKLRLNSSQDDFKSIEDVTEKVDTINSSTGEVIFKEDMVEGSSRTEKILDMKNIEIQARHIKNRQKQLFSSKDIAISDIMIEKGEYEYPAFYEYELKYLHKDLKKSDKEQELTEDDIEEIKRNISIENNRGNKINEKELPYEIIINRTEDGIRESIELYKIKILFAFNPNLDTFYVKYNPEPNIFVNNYSETINAEKIYKRVDQKEFYEKKDDENIYTSEEVENGYYIIAPQRSEVADSSHEKIRGHISSPTIPFNYEVSIESRESKENQGIEVLFLVDNSKFLENDMPEDYSNKANAIEEFLSYYKDKMIEDIEKQKGSKIDSIFKIATFNEEINPIESFDDTYSLDISDSHNSNLNYALNKRVIEEFGKEEKEGFKKAVVILSAGRRTEPLSAEMFRFVKEDIKREGIVDDIWCFKFGVETENSLKDHLDELAFDYQKSKQILDKKSLEEKAKEAVFFTAPFTKRMLAQSGSTTVNKFNPVNLGYINNMITTSLSDSEARIEVKTSSIKNDEINIGIYKEEVIDGELKTERINHDGGDFAIIDTEAEGKKYFVEITSNNLAIFNTKKYYVQTEEDFAQISVSINSELSKNKSWHLNIKDGTFKRADRDNTYHYAIPELNYEDFEDDEERIGQRVGAIIEKTGSHSVKTTMSDLYIETKAINLDKRHGFVKTDFDITDGSYKIEVPKNIKLYNEDGQEYTIINWKKETGELETLEYISDDILFIDYEFYTYDYIYEGYFDENNEFVKLDLNPRKGHTYTQKDIYDGRLEERPSTNLYDEIIYLYMMPENVLDKQDKVVRGSRSQFTLFHTIGEELVPNQNNNRPLHPYIKDHIEQGHFNIDDVLLIAKIYINPVSNPELIEMKDVRTRGGGLKDRIIDGKSKTNPMVQGYFDIGQFDGEIYPQNGVTVIEIPEKALDSLSKKDIEEKVNKHFPLGSLPIIKYV